MTNFAKDPPSLGKDPFSFDEFKQALQPALEFLEQAKPDDQGITRVSGNAGKAALEISPSKACLYVQNVGVSKSELVRGGAGLLQLLTHFFPSWAKSNSWLNRSLASKCNQESFSRESKLINLKKTSVGVFLTISGPEIKS